MRSESKPSLESQPPKSATPTRLVDIATVATMLGVEVRHVRRLVQERRLPFVKWGHLLRFDEQEIAVFIDSNRVPARTRP